MHVFIKWIWGLLGKHRAFLSRTLITNLQYFCHKLTWKSSLSEVLALDADSLQSACVWWGMLWKETRHTGLKNEASQSGRGKLRKNWNRTSTMYQETADPRLLQQAVPLLRSQQRSQKVVPKHSFRKKILRYEWSLTFNTCWGMIILCIWWEEPCCSLSEMPPVTNRSILMTLASWVMKSLFS